ncbi:hypothetical protein INT43_007602 [Umbelopsis isabellina]|uniref:PB1 domain-containing protein n=1 Tax=Mortierella isabellina TaxID=91625 RepID=A0A8H7UEH3_MORIS|nr:hypothetical protein INT43_007602 [Umbelopsis isabellina]
MYAKQPHPTIRLLTTHITMKGAKDVRLMLYSVQSEHWPALLGRLQRKFNDENIRALKYLDADGNFSMIADSEDLMVAIESVNPSRGELLCWTLRHGESL